MKRMVILLWLFCSLSLVHAGVVIKQKIEGAMQHGDLVMDIGNDKIRTDMPAGPRGSMSTIMSLDTGDTIMLMHEQKVATKIPGAQMKQRMEMMKRQMHQESAGNTAVPKPRDTGKSAKIGGYNTEIYLWTNSSGIRQKLWIAKDYPDYKKFNAALEKVSNSPAGAANRGMSPDVGSLPGMIMKSQIEMGGRQITVTLVSAKEEKLAPSIFEIPAGYREISEPAMRPGMEPPGGSGGAPGR